MFERTTALLRDDSTQLALRHQPAAADVRPRAILVLLHGLAEHSGRYARFADFMAQRGFQVYAHDHRGHGMTQAPDAPLGRFATHDGGLRVVEDVLVVIETARERHPALPVFLFGHSMGGLIAWNTVLAAPPRPGARGGGVEREFRRHGDNGLCTQRVEGGARVARV